MVVAETPTFIERLRALPAKPGVYLMRDKSGVILYVGKAAKLRSRVTTYFGSPQDLPPKIRQMVRRIADFEFIVTESEQEALILESNLIKEHQPQYNARLKDDKSYPFIKIDTTEDFPLVYVTRRVKEDGARYFGPFASASSVRKTLALLKKLFPYRSCHQDHHRKRRQGLSGLLHPPMRGSVYRPRRARSSTTRSLIRLRCSSKVEPSRLSGESKPAWRSRQETWSSNAPRLSETR